MLLGPRFDPSPGPPGVQGSCWVPGFTYNLTPLGFRVQVNPGCRRGKLAASAMRVDCAAVCGRNCVSVCLYVLAAM